MHQTCSADSNAVVRARLARAAVCAALAAALASSAAAAAERTVLRNGITVIARQDASSDIAGVQLLIGVAQGHEGADHDGIRTLLGEMLLQGLRGRLQDSAELEPLRRQQDAAPERVPFNTGTHWGFASLHGAVTSDALPDCLRLLASAAFEAELTQEQLVKSRDALNATRAQSLERDPVRQTYLLLRKALTGESRAAVSLLGTEEALARISLDGVFGFWKSAYAPSNAYVAIVSPLPTGKAVALAKDAFGRFPAGPRLAEADPLPADAADVEVEGSRDLLRLARPNSPPPASLMLGVPIPPTGSPDAVVAEVISAILGRPDGSLARDRELTKALPFATLSPLAPVQTLLIRGGAVAPHMTVQAFCDAYKIEDAKAALLGHLKRLQTEQVAEADLAAARAFVINQAAREHETKLDQAELLAKSEVLGSGYKHDAAFARLVADVTPQDVRRVARQYFRRPALAVQLPVSP